MFARLFLAPLPIQNRLADWWPAAVIGLVALLGYIPEGAAQPALGL